MMLSNNISYPLQLVSCRHFINDK